VVEGDDERGGPSDAQPPARLDQAERRRVALAGFVPIAVAALVLLPVGFVTGAGVGEVLAAAVVYGGLLGLAAAFVTVDRLHARQCPRCRTRNARGTARCGRCGYDLVVRPRFACDERHTVHLDDDGLCACGRRLKPLPTARGIGPEIAFTLKVGAWLLALLIGIGLALQLLERSL
jgi:hypothetical protein